MDAGELYSFIFESYAGMGLLIGAGLVISLIVSVIFELRTRKRYKNHEAPTEEDEWTIFEENVANGFAEEEAEEQAKREAQ